MMTELYYMYIMFFFREVVDLELHQRRMNLDINGKPSHTMKQTKNNTDRDHSKIQVEWFLWMTSGWQSWGEMFSPFKST